VVEDRDLVRDPARALEADHDLGLVLVADPDLGPALVVLDLNPDLNPALDPNLEVDLDQLIAMGIPRRMVIVTDPDPAPNLDLSLDLNPDLNRDLNPDLNPNLEVDPGPNLGPSPEMIKKKEKKRPKFTKELNNILPLRIFVKLISRKNVLKKPETEPFSYTTTFFVLAASCV